MADSLNSESNIVVGCGISGAVIANLIATKFNEKVIIIEKKSHIAGSCFDYRDNNGICIHKYGSHIFHTNSEIVWKYLSQFTKFNDYKHNVIALVDGIETNIPFNFNSLYQVFPKEIALKIQNKLIENYGKNSKIPILDLKKEKDNDLNFLADFIYKKIFFEYTKKQWGIPPEKIDSTVTARVPIYIGKDNRYFHDKYQGIPINGYTELIKKMISHPNITVKLNTNYKNIKLKYKRLFYTGSIDEFFDYKYGKLPYRSLKFELEEYNCTYYQKKAVVNYTTSEDFTRIHEYKYYLNDKSNKTVIAKEYSENFEEGKNERYYPIINKKNLILYNKYLDEAKHIKNLWFFGRLGDYKYYNIDEAIIRAISLIEGILENDKSFNNRSNL